MTQTIIGLNLCDFRGIVIPIRLLHLTMVPLLRSGVAVLPVAVGAALLFFINQIYYGKNPTGRIYDPS